MTPFRFGRAKGAASKRDRFCAFRADPSGDKKRGDAFLEVGSGKASEWERSPIPQLSILLKPFFRNYSSETICQKLFWELQELCCDLQKLFRDLQKLFRDLQKLFRDFQKLFYDFRNYSASSETIPRSSES